MNDVKVYVKFDDDGHVISFQGRQDSEPNDDEIEFPFEWGGSIGDHKDDFDKNGIKINN
jgi:hypothetical protein